jgi:hypothetical protein
MRRRSALMLVVAASLLVDGRMSSISRLRMIGHLVKAGASIRDLPKRVITFAMLIGGISLDY